MDETVGQEGFKVTYVNFGWGPEEVFPSVDAALKRARQACFQSRIDDSKGNPVGSWCPIGGYRKW